MQFKQGDIFASVYTADFFEVVSATSKAVTVKAISDKGELVDAQSCHSYETSHLPISGSFQSCPFFSREQNETGKRCKVQPSCPAKPDKPYIKISESVWAIPWDGKAAIVDHYN